MSVTREELYILHETVCESALDTMKKKNQDYACAEDPYRNFRMFGRLGILVRMSDKLARLRTFDERKMLDVSDENIEDTVKDLVNYAVLYLGYE